MPLFEFECRDCESRFERLVRATESVSCPQCDSEDLERLLGAPAGLPGRSRQALPVTSDCPPPDAPPCGPGCCRL